MNQPALLYDRIRETTATSGTGTITLAGAQSTYQSFSVVGDANLVYYCIVDSQNGGWEVGLGTYSVSGPSLARTTILASSNGGSAVNFGGNVKDVLAVYPAWTMNRNGYTLADHYADAGSVGSSETDLYSDSIPGNTFLQNGDKLDAQYVVQMVMSTPSKRVKLYFAGTMLFDTGAQSFSSATGQGLIVATLIRDTSTSIRYGISCTVTNSTPQVIVANGKLTGLTLTGANTLKITGTSTGVGVQNNDVLALMATIRRWPAG